MCVASDGPPSGSDTPSLHAARTEAARSVDLAAADARRMLLADRAARCGRRRAVARADLDDEVQRRLRGATGVGVLAGEPDLVADRRPGAAELLHLRLADAVDRAELVLVDPLPSGLLHDPGPRRNGRGERDAGLARRRERRAAD